MSYLPSWISGVSNLTGVHVCLWPAMAWVLLFVNINVMLGSDFNILLTSNSLWSKGKRSEKDSHPLCRCAHLRVFQCSTVDACSALVILFMPKYIERKKLLHAAPCVCHCAINVFAVQTLPWSKSHRALYLRLVLGFSLIQLFENGWYQLWGSSLEPETEEQLFFWSGRNWNIRIVLDS